MASRKELLAKVERSIEIATGGYSPEITSLIINDENGRSINWEKVAEFAHRSDLHVGAVLIDLEVLSFDAEGNYELFQQGRSRNQHGSMNPQSGLRTYFEQKEDALAYREALIQNTETKVKNIFSPINLAQYLD